MRYKEIKIEAGKPVQAVLTTYLLDNYDEIDSDRKRPMVLICPGGGYEWVSNREGEAVAMQFVAAGCHAAVLRYDTHKEGVIFPQELIELAAAVAHIRENASAYGVDSDKILVLGFSAGGHLAASLGTFWQEAWLEEELKMQPESYKPNGLILGYPVITSGEYAHRGSIDNLMGEKAGRELQAKLSLENQVTSKVPPVFMWHTYEDGAVPVENSMYFAQALKKAGVSLEYHIFPRGGHGLSLATRETASPALKEIEPQCQQWIGLCCNWIKYNF